MKTFLILAAPLLLAMPAAAQTHRTIEVRHDHDPIVQGSGNYVREPRAMTGFSAIESSGAENIEVAIGNTPSVEIEIDDNLVTSLTTRVENGVLKIGSKGSFRITRAPVVRITMPALRAITSSGSGDSEIRGLAGGELMLVSRGSGGFSAPSGRIDRVTLNLAGSGDTDLTKLDVRDAAVDLSGSGTARIRVRDSIVARISGSGNILHSGHTTKVDSRVTGTGSVRQID